MDPKKQDASDASTMGITNLSSDRPDAVMPVGRWSEDYNMKHKKRGMAVIIAYSEFKAGGPDPRPCAKHDIKKCKTAFEKLNYEVSVHSNLTRKDFLDCLQKVSDADHSDNDSLVVIFMSHGGVYEGTNQEYVDAYDGKISTFALWRNFTPKKCPSLAGKPKMFFIQACRGGGVDKGVQLRTLKVETDSINQNVKDTEEDYSIPLHADMLMMWASYPGMVSFKAKREDIQGSVFIHFLAKIISEFATKEELFSMLVRITREVAIEYESNIPSTEELDKNKQIPQIVSTLMRKVHFF